MWIWNPEPELPLDHILVIPSWIRTLKSQLGESANQIFSLDRTESWHLTGFLKCQFYSINGGKRQISGNAQQDPALQDLFQLIPASFKCPGIRINALKSGNLAVIGMIIVKDFIFRMTHRGSNIIAQHACIIFFTAISTPFAGKKIRSNRISSRYEIF